MSWFECVCKYTVLIIWYFNDFVSGKLGYGVSLRTFLPAGSPNQMDVYNKSMIKL